MCSFNVVSSFSRKPKATFLHDLQYDCKLFLVSFNLCKLKSLKKIKWYYTGLY